MAKKDENLEAQQAAEAAAAEQTPSATPNRDNWFAKMRGKYGEDKSEEELYDLSTKGYDEEHESNKRFIAEANDLEEIVKANPELGSVFNDIFERGKDGNPEMGLRNLPDELKRYITDENYGDEEYIAAKNKRKEEESAKQANDERLVEMRNQAFEEVCKEDGVEPETALEALNEIFNNPCETLEQCKKQVRDHLKMINYDSAVASAEVRGRNANIAEQRRSVPKSAPAGGAGVTAAAAPKKPNSIFDTARGDE